MKDLITEARELGAIDIEKQPIHAEVIIEELCDALEKAEEQNRQLLREVSNLAAESVKRDVTLARLEAEVMAALREQAERDKGCVWCKEDNKVFHDGQHFHFFCSYCGKRLEDKT